MRKVNVLLVGIGGYGCLALEAVLKADKLVNLAGVVQRNITKYEAVCQKLKALNIPIFEKIEDFYVGFKADLVIISTPIQYHCHQTCIALNNGSNVLCEKPACATIEEARRMEEASKVNGKFVAIGYQWSYTDVILELKKDILSGKFGKAKRLKTLLLRPRSNQYYRRNNWAGKIKDPDGQWVLDSVAHNAGSHNIHNMLYMLGDSVSTSAMPVMVETEVYRANKIDNYDTAITRIITDKQTEILFYGTHASCKTYPIQFVYEFEKAKIQQNPNIDSNIIAYMNDGEVIEYGNPDLEPLKKLWTVIEAVQQDKEIPCNINSAIPEILCINAMQRALADNSEFPVSMLRHNVVDEETFTYVEGIDQIMQQCFMENTLPSELGVGWAKKACTINL
jgi:predicted dehydrogenase